MRFAVTQRKFSKNSSKVFRFLMVVTLINTLIIKLINNSKINNNNNYNIIFNGNNNINSNNT